MITLQARKLIKTIDESPEIFNKIDLKLVFSPLHRQILHFAKVLYDHKQPCTSKYLKEAIRARMSSAMADKAIAEIDDIHEHDYWIGGDINKILRSEYNENIFFGIGKIMANEEYEEEQKLKKIEKLITGLSGKNISSDVQELIDEIIEYTENPGKGEILKRYKIKDPLLVSIFGDYIYASPYLIAGRPGDYKTTLLICLIIHLNHMGYNGLHFSIEDSKYVFAVKYSSANFNIPKNDIFSNTIPLSAIDKMKANKPEGHTHVFDRGIDKDDFKREIRDHVRNYNISFCTLDYVQLVRTNGMAKHEGLGEFSYIVMEVCKEFEIPVIMTGQLNRENEGQKPKLGNIKDCGSIEQDVRYLYALWNHSNNTQNNKRNLSILKDSTRGIMDLEIIFNAEVGNIRNVQKVNYKKDKGEML